MAWVKVPKENHPLFHDCLPRDPRVSTVNMFGGVAAMVNGRMFAGLFGRGAIVKLAPSDQRAALALDGAVPFDPMGTGRVMHHTILLPEAVIDEPDQLRAWLSRAFDHVVTLPAKKSSSRAVAKATRSHPPARVASVTMDRTARRGPKAAEKKAPAKKAPAKKTSAKPARAQRRGSRPT